MSNQVAETILAQLGGRRFIAMTGAKNFVGGTDELRFHLPARLARCKNGPVDRFGIRLDTDDTYTLEAGKWNPKRLEVVRQVIAQGIHCDNLRETFTRMTGLHTSL